MRIVFLLCCCIIAASSCFCQTTDGLIYLYKKDGSPAKDIKESSYFMNVVVQNNSTYISRYFTGSDKH